MVFSIIIFSINEFVILETAVIGRQQLVQFLDKFKKLVAVLFRGDLRAKLLNTVTLRFAHDRQRRSGSITVFTVEVCSMSNAAARPGLR